MSISGAWFYASGSFLVSGRRRSWVERIALRCIFAFVLGWVGFLSGTFPASADGASLFSSENNKPGFTVRTWSTKDGLPENTVMALYQTRDGYLWVGTADGLARFDGVQFRSYGTSDGLPSSSITALMEDRHGTLWIGTAQGLASITDGSRSPPDFKNELAGVDVTGLAEDAQGRLWIGTHEGLYEATPGQTQLRRMDKRMGLPAQEIQSLYADHSGAIWVWGTSLKLFQIVNEQATEVPVDFPLPKARYLLTMLEDRSGRLWASVGNGYLLCRENGHWRSFGENEGVPFHYVSCLAETRDGTFWAGSYGQGLFYLHQGQFLPAEKNQVPADELIHSLWPDAEGNLWIGTSSSGLACLQPQQLKVLSVRDGLSNEVVRAISEMPDGTLVAATENGIYRKKTGPVRFERQMSSKPDIYPWTRSVLATRDSNLWWSADDYLFDYNSAVKMGYPTGNLAALPGHNIVISLHEDHSNNVWVGMNKGLWREQAGELAVVNALPHSCAVVALASAPDGTIFVGTDNSGVYLLRQGTTIQYTKRQGLQSNSIRALYYDPTGVLWIGTHSGGLSRLKDGGIFTYTTQQGLVNDTISQIVEDDEGALWLGSNRGISRVTKQELEALAAGKIDSLHPLNLGQEDGMLAEECSGGTNPSELKSRSGLLYFSTIKGIVVIDPKRYPSHDAPPQVIIEYFLVNGRAPASHASPSVSENKGAPEIVLSPGQNNLEFHFTGLHSAAPEFVNFRYQLAGIDQGWVDAGSRRFANYNQIPPGHYRFRVLAANRDGVWSPAVATMALFLRPYFYQTWWFQTGVVVLAMLAVALFVRHMVKRRLQRRLQLLEMEQRLENERRRIARDLHDELGARLTGIAHLGELAVRNSQSSDEMKLQISSLTNRVQQLMGAMDEVVWTINPQNDSLPNIVAFLSDYAERFLAPTGIGWRLNLDPEFPDLSVPAQSRHNLLLAAKETLSNAVRHAGATMIQMSIQIINGRLVIAISDNGRGFEMDHVRSGGNGLANIRNRMELVKGHAEIRSKTGQGTTVILSVLLPEVTGKN